MRSTIIEHTGGHVRVLGPPGAGKTRHLVERFRWLEGQGRRVAVITYGPARRERMTGELLERGSARRGHMPVWTFPQLARHVLAAAEPGLRGPLRELQELVLLDRVLGDLDGGLSSDYRSISESPAFRRELLGVIHTLLQNGIGAPEAVTGRDATGDGRARDILRVFVDFRQLLDERRMTTFYDAPWHAARVIGELANPFAGFDTLLVDDFGDIDPGQFKLLLAASPPGGTIEVNVFGDPSGARFGYRGTSGRFLTEEFAQHYAPTDYELSPVVSKAPERGESQMGLFDTRPVAPSDGRVSTVATYAEDDVAEAQMTADRAAEIVSSGSHALGDIAVIAREPHRYERVLSAAFFDRGVALDTGRRGHYAIDDYVSAWFVLLTTDVNERNAERLAASPLYDALRARVADELRLHERKVGGDLYDVRDIVRWARKQLPRATFSMERFVDVVVRPVVPDAVNDVRSMAALSHLVDEWGSYVEALSHLGGKADLAGFRRFVATSPPGRSSEPNQDAVRLLSPLEATGQSFAVVFVVGCSEGIFPVVESGAGYIPFSELERCVPSSPPIHFHQARTREERINDERLLLDSALSRARETLYLSAPKEFDATEIAAPSHLFGDRFEGAPTVERAESVVVHAARAVAVAGAGTFESTRDAPATATQVEAIWLANPAKAAPFQIDSFAMSPSRLSTYDDCPRKLFYDRVLGLKDEGKIYMTIGSLFHALMEKIGVAFPTRAAIETSLSDEVIDQMVEELCDAEHGLGRRDSIMNVAMRKYLAGLGAEFRAMEKTRVGDYRIDRTEVTEGYEVAGISFRGKIDRVDDVGGKVVVIDYKTGKIHKTGKSLREYSLGEKSGDRHWQIPMYSYGIANKTGQWPHAFCYYVFPPDGEPIIVGLFVADSMPDLRHFADIPSKRFDSISPAELQTLMTDAADITTEIFGERERFERTDDLKKCANCYFNRLCMRHET